MPWVVFRLFFGHLSIGGWRFQVSGQGIWALGLLVQGFKFKVPVETCRVFFLRSSLGCVCVCASTRSRTACRTLDPRSLILFMEPWNASRT